VPYHRRLSGLPSILSASRGTSPLTRETPRQAGSASSAACEPMHHRRFGRDGIVWKVGDQVKRWKVFDEGGHPPATSPAVQCPECNGLDQMDARSEIWGYETTGCSFAHSTKVPAQHSERSRSPRLAQLRFHVLTYFTRTDSVHQAEVTAGDNVLVWCAAGGLASRGAIAGWLCAIPSPWWEARASRAGEVSGRTRRSANRNYMRGSALTCRRYPGPVARRAWRPARKFGKRLRGADRGNDVDVVFVHGDRDVPTRCSAKSSEVVICGATTGSNREFRRPAISGCGRSRSSARTSPTPHQSDRANHLVTRARIRRASPGLSLASRTANAHAG